MHIAIDLQALQSPTSRQRGIGRYTEAFLRELLDIETHNHYSLLANGPIEGLDFLSSSKWPFHNVDYPTDYETEINSLILKTTLLSKNIDAYFIPSPMEGLDAVIPKFKGFSKRIYTICYDLIPLIFPDTYWSIPGFQDHYLRRLKNISNSDFVFAISEATRQDAIKHLNISPDHIVNISGGVSDFFRPLHESEHHQWNEHFREKFKITKPFVMYAGGEDWRKNIEGLIRSFANLPAHLKQKYDLVIACKLSPSFCESMQKLANQLGIKDSLVITNYVSDEELRALYSNCYLFVFPSFYEGFGLPALEAMSCGAATIGASTSSVPEIIGAQDQLFDPHQSEQITSLMARVLSDSSFHIRLRERSLKQASNFTWKSVAQKIADVFSDQPPVDRYSISFSRISDTVRKTEIAYFKGGRNDIKGSLTKLLIELLSEKYEVELFCEPEDTQAQSKLATTTHNMSSFEDRLSAHHYEFVFYEVGSCPLSKEVLRKLKLYPGIVFLTNVKHLSLDDVKLIAQRSFGIVVFDRSSYRLLLKKIKAPEEQLIFWDLSLDTQSADRFNNLLLDKILSSKDKNQKQVADYVGRECASLVLGAQNHLSQLGKIIADA